METAPVQYAFSERGESPALLSVCRTHTTGSGRASPLSRGSRSGG